MTETKALSYATVSERALLGNYRIFRRMIPAGVKMLTLMKANAYGHGSVWAARLLEREGCDFFGVATAGEAMELRENGIQTPILILGYTPACDIPTLADAGVSQCVPDLEAAREYSEILQKTGKTLRIHIKLDTGMGRYGLNCRDTDAAAEEAVAIAHCPQLLVEGMFTHFADADNPQDAYTPIQEQRFAEVYRKVTEAGVPVEIAHCENSAAMIKYDGFRFDMVRLGISLYGIAPSEPTPLPQGLRPVMALHSTITQVREIPAGESISYARRYITPVARRIAIARLGYGDGFPRALTNRAEFLIHGKKVHQVGTICMDALMIDVTDVPEARRGDDVLVWGADGEQELSVQSVANACGTIPYELVTQLLPRVPRVAVE